MVRRKKTSPQFHEDYNDLQHKGLEDVSPFTTVDSHLSKATFKITFGLLKTHYRVVGFLS